MTGDCETHLGHAEVLGRLNPMFSPCWMLLPSRTCVCTCVPAHTDCIVYAKLHQHMPYSRAPATASFNCLNQEIYPAAIDQPLCDPSPKLKLANEQTFLSPTCSCLHKPNRTKAVPSYLYTNIACTYPPQLDGLVVGRQQHSAATGSSAPFDFIDLLFDL